MGYQPDVIIVGAGPAGSITAVLLAQKGYDVLLLDRDDFPRDKVCGDALPAKIFDLLTAVGMIGKIRSNMHENAFYPVRKMRLLSPKGYRVNALFNESKNGFYPHVVPRLIFDNIIKEHALESGAQFRRIKVDEPLLENGAVTGVRFLENAQMKEIRARVVVGADGVSSATARALRKNKRHDNRHRAVAIRAYIEPIDLFSQEMEFYLLESILPGYAWIFPTAANRANIGLGMRLDYFRRGKNNLKKMLAEFVAMPVVNNRLSSGWRLQGLATWLINFGSQRGLRYAFNGALLVGDAAGFVNPLTGGGIYRSLLSGQFAAEVIDKALRKNDYSYRVLSEYELLIRSGLLRSLKYYYKIQKLLYRFPVLVDFYARFLQGCGFAERFVTTKLDF